ISAAADGAGGNDVYAITADQHLWEHTPSGWAMLSAGSFAQVTAATNKSGAAVVFAVLADHSLWENSSLFAGNPWRMLSPGGTVLSASAGGADEVFAVTADHHLWDHTSSGWAMLSGGWFVSVGGAKNAAGRGEAFAVVADGSLWEYNPAFTGTPWQQL